MKPRREALICGCGPSIKQGRPELPVYGVNDVDKYVPADILIIPDHPLAFSEDRIKTIQNTSAARIVVLSRSWQKYLPIDTLETPKVANIEKVGNLRLGPLAYGIVSPILAISVAIRDGFDVLLLLGVDFTGERWDKWIDQINMEFLALRDLAEEVGIEIHQLSKQSRLSYVT